MAIAPKDAAAKAKQDPFEVNADYLDKDEVAQSGKTFTVVDIIRDDTNEYKNKPSPRWCVFVEGGYNGQITLGCNPTRDKSMAQAIEKLPISDVKLVKIGDSYRLTTK